MSDESRRQFLQMATMAAAGSALGVPAVLQRALAVPADVRTGTLADVQHVIVLMQENRSFDHYFGTLKGVRGFSDPHPIALPGGRAVWQQPAGHGKTVPPFHLDTAHQGSLWMPSLDHNWKETHDLWKHHDAWIARKTALTMGYFTRADLPFYHALADAFTICDSYHCSIFGPTSPNRLYFMSGTSGLAVGNDALQVIANPDGEGNETADPKKDNPAFKGFGWTTYAERLEAADIDWKVYQEYDNYGDNELSYFAAFRGLPENSSLYRRARRWSPGSDATNTKSSRGEYLIAEMEADIVSGRLPQVSWVVGSTLLCEHPSVSSPAYGEIFVAHLIDMLSRHPETWSKTVLLINYDENDGIFDHIPMPTPAVTPDMGRSMFPTDGEVYHGVPVGLGARVPMLVVSPWSKGGFVNSELFDHTSVIRFLEARFGVREPNITPWRRAVCGDLTSAFDFAAPNAVWDVRFPPTSANDAAVARAMDLPLPHPPAHAEPHPKQEPGQRPARPIGYALSCDGVHTDDGRFRITLQNSGTLAACLIVYAHGAKAGPWYYSVAAGATLSDDIAAAGIGNFNVHGPNGFFRAFRGPAHAASLRAAITFAADGTCLLRLENVGKHPLRATVRNHYDSTGPVRTVALDVGAYTEYCADIAANDHWYDVEIVAGVWSWRFAGHYETGRVSRSDPALGAG